MCFLGTKKPPRKHPKPQPPAKIICPFQSQPGNRTSKLPHHVHFPPPPPPPPSNPTPKPTFFLSKPKQKPKPKPKKQEMIPYVPVHAYGFPVPPLPPPTNHGQIAIWNYNDYTSFEQSLELSRYRERERVAKEERERKVVEERQGREWGELERFRERQWRRDDAFQGLMMESLRERIKVGEKGEKDGGGAGGEWKKEVGGLRKEVEEMKREREMGDTVAVAKARAEAFKEAREEEKAKKEKESFGWGDRDNREREYGRYSREQDGFDWDRGRGDWNQKDRGKKALEDRFDDIEIFGRGMALGRQEAQPLPTPARRPLLGERRGGFGYGGEFHYKEDSYEGYEYSHGMPWHQPHLSERRDPLRRGACPGTEGLRDGIKGVQSSLGRFEDRFRLEDAKRGIEKDFRQQYAFDRLADTVGQMNRRLGC
ncbi:uncharacterized protein LY89DRAFT_739219 [Mollisia scopiformis]|uniref:Uncharacterized protein n=1 Tax=Mollisia scopiformis TaxID=149040 RepID=A0A194WSR1_MOLSC|nr:uncharacterized protein LY89DRAFT_739219 [Mollisia scopiformis]KUJ11000.1 hypothetical protein LY89DRAFT_739219 [Mollisia scopiformis]